MKKIVLLFCLLVTLWSTIAAQQYYYSPINQYFRNGHLWNPAFTGAKEHPSLSAIINHNWMGFEGAPVLFVLSSDMKFGNHSGMGVRFASEKGGLLQRTSAAIDYAFTIDFSETERLRLGISGGVFMERFDNTVNATDPILPGFNNKAAQMDGSFGFAYETKHLMLGGSLYNLRFSIQQSGKQLVADRARANFMVAYKHFLSEEENSSIQPLISYKMYSISEPLIDAGAQLDIQHLFNVAVMWRNTGSLIGTAGTKIKGLGELNVSYVSPNKYGYGSQYELGVGIDLK